MANNDVVRQTLEYYRQQRDSKVTEVARLNFMISQLEADLGESQSGPSPEAASLTGDLAAASRSFSAAPREPELRRDEFVGLTQVAAVKAYLNKVKRAVPLDQLAEAIKRGGATLGGAVPTKTLYVSLARNPNKDFVFLDDDYIGLREFYPSLPKASTARTNGKKTKPSRKTKTKTAAPRKTKSPASKPKPEKKGPPAAEIKKALSSILSSVAIPDVKGLTAAVQAKLGTPVHHLSVFRALQDDALFEKTEKGFKSRHSAA